MEIISKFRVKSLNLKVIRNFTISLKPKRCFFYVIVFLGFTSFLSIQSFGKYLGKELADWTVMVYMNGDNNLEPFALENFNDMAKVGSSDRINIIVQFDRIAK